MNNTSKLKPTDQYANLLRRLGAIFYDTLSVFAILIAVTGIGMALNEGKDIHQSYLFQAILVLTIFSYFSCSWLQGGQTLGMKAWRMQIKNSSSGQLTLTQCSIRFLVAVLSIACIGMGYLWSLIDNKKRTWHDLCSKSEILVIPK